MKAGTERLKRLYARSEVMVLNREGGRVCQWRQARGPA